MRKWSTSIWFHSHKSFLFFKQSKFFSLQQKELRPLNKKELELKEELGDGFYSDEDQNRMEASLKLMKNLCSYQYNIWLGCMRSHNFHLNSCVKPTEDLMKCSGDIYGRLENEFFIEASIKVLEED